MNKIYNKNAREKALLEEAYSNVYNDPENISGLRWSEEYDIKDVTSPDDLKYADQGDAFLFDDVDLLFPNAGSEQEVMDLLSDHGDWELKDNPYGAIVVKVGDILDNPSDDAKYETEYTDSYKQRQGGREF